MKPQHQQPLPSTYMTESERQQLRPGQIVMVKLDDGSVREFEVRCAPWQPGYGEWLIGLVGIGGEYSLRRVQSVKE